jgi:hypothetical protein
VRTSFGAVVLALAAVAPAAAQGRDDRKASADNLKEIGLAMHGHHDTFGTFPPAAIFDNDGKPLLSWRVAILPFVGQQQLFKQFRLNEPWDSPHNKKLLERMPRVYAAPGAETTKGMTFYRVFTGSGTVFEGKRGLRLTAIPDGTSNTILAVEAGAAVPWTKPDDLPYDAKKPLPKVGGVFQDGFHALFADGVVRFVSRRFDEAALRKCITRADGEPVDPDSLTGKGN